MKKRMVLSIVMVLVMCLGLAVPVFSAENTSNGYDSIDDIASKNNNELITNNIELVDTLTFEQTEATLLKLVSNSDAQVTKYEATFDKGMVDVYTSLDNVKQKTINEFVNRANYAIKQEIAVALANNEAIPEEIEYVFTDGEIQVVCNTANDISRNYLTANDFYITQMSITESVEVEENADVISGNWAVTQTGDGGIGDGIGIRHYAVQDGQYMTATVTNCPPLNLDKTINGVKNSSYSFYHYIGFTNDKDLVTDMGLLYSNARQGWLPYMKVNQNGKVYMIQHPKTDVVNVGYERDDLGSTSAFGMTSPVTITAYKTVPGYNDGENDGAATVRLTVKGTRITPLTTNIMCIAEAGTGVSESVRWKALTTIAGSENIPQASNASAPRIEMKYSNVKIGTQDATWSTASDGKTEDRSRITSKGSGYIEGKVNFN